MSQEKIYEKEPKKRGRPKGKTKLDFNDPALLEMIKRMKKVGLSDEEMSHCLGLGRSTLGRAIARNDKLWEAIYEGRQDANLRVVEAAFNMATDEKHERMTMFWLRSRMGWKEGIEIDANISHQIIYETRLSGNKVKQNVISAGGESIEIDAEIDDDVQKIIDLEVGDECQTPKE